MGAKSAQADPRPALPGLLERLDAGGRKALESHLLAHSNLPGPRGNLELSAAFAAAVRDRLENDPQTAPPLWALCEAWAKLDLAAAPVNDPHEFLVFCAAQASAEFGADRRYAKELWLRLRALASDSRWRTREGVAMALQRLLGSATAAARRELKRWSREAGQWLLLRAVVAAVAEPALLVNKDQIEFAFAVHGEVLKQFGRAKERGSAEFKTLRQGLGYTLSVVAAADPERGWKVLDELAATGDSGLLWIVRENLKKKRLIATDPARAAELSKRIAALREPG
jgi:hypothetical protein